MDVLHAAAAGNWEMARARAQDLAGEFAETATKVAAAADEAISAGLDTEEYDPDGILAADPTPDDEVEAWHSKVTTNADLFIADGKERAVRKPKWELYGLKQDPDALPEREPDSSGDDALVHVPSPFARVSPPGSPLAPPPAVCLGGGIEDRDKVSPSSPSSPESAQTAGAASTAAAPSAGKSRWERVSKVGLPILAAVAAGFFVVDGLLLMQYLKFNPLDLLRGAR